MVIQQENRDFLDYLKKVSPGTNLRQVIDDLITSELGALIVIDSPNLSEIVEGGFKVNCKFSPQKLFELCKMDGAVIISSDLKKILYANALLIPDVSIETEETGTRHKAAERTAKQAETFVIAVSERKKKASLYFSKTKHFLRNARELLGEVINNLQILEKQREIFNELLTNLDILEASSLVSVKEVARFLQRAEIIMKISDNIKRYFTELGKEGNIMNLRYKELMRGVEKAESGVIRGYSMLSLKKTKKILENFSHDDLLDIENIARTILGKPLEDSLSPRGYRFLSYLDLDEKEISLIINKLGNLDNIFKAREEDFEKVLKNRGKEIKEEIEDLRNQVLSSKIIY